MDWINVSVINYTNVTETNNGKREKGTNAETIIEYLKPRLLWLWWYYDDYYEAWTETLIVIINHCYYK